MSAVVAKKMAAMEEADLQVILNHLTDATKAQINTQAGLSGELDVTKLKTALEGKVGDQVFGLIRTEAAKINEIKEVIVKLAGGKVMAPIKSITEIEQYIKSNTGPLKHASEDKLAKDIKFDNELFGRYQGSAKRAYDIINKTDAVGAEPTGTLGDVFAQLEGQMKGNESIKSMAEALKTGGSGTSLDSLIKSNAATLKKDANKLSDGIYNAVREHKLAHADLLEAQKKINEKVSKAFKEAIKDAGKDEAKRKAVLERFEEVVELTKDQFGEKLRVHEDAMSHMKDMVGKLEENGVKLNRSFNFELGERGVLNTSAVEAGVKEAEAGVADAGKGAKGGKTGYIVAGGVVGALVGRAMAGEGNETVGMGVGGAVGAVTGNWLGGLIRGRAAQQMMEKAGQSAAQTAGRMV